MQQAAVKRLGDKGYLTGSDVGLALGIVIILTVLFLPVSPIILDIGLAFSIALSALILMVSLWIQRPLDFSAFPTVLLIATIMRLAAEYGDDARDPDAWRRGLRTRPAKWSHGFSQFRDGRRFRHRSDHLRHPCHRSIFVVITKGATRIAEVGARFTLDAIPGKQMAIDADLSSGLIDDKEAQRRRRELEEESAFFGADGRCLKIRAWRRHCLPHHYRHQHLWRHHHRRDAAWHGRQREPPMSLQSSLSAMVSSPKSRH